MNDKWIIPNNEKVFLTSDTHFSHNKIIEFCKRPFSSVEEMDNTLINNWNKVVPKDGIVFHLGDFCFKGSQRWKQLFEQLNGKIILIKGNHDERMQDSILNNFLHVTYQMRVQYKGKWIYLNHYPFACYSETYRPDKTYQFHGHTHLNNRENSGKDVEICKGLFKTQLDVGVDNNNFYPITFDKALQQVENQLLTNKFIWQ